MILDVGANAGIYSLAALAAALYSNRVQELLPCVAKAGKGLERLEFVGDG